MGLNLQTRQPCGLPWQLLAFAIESFRVLAAEAINRVGQKCTRKPEVISFCGRSGHDFGSVLGRAIS